MVAKQMGLVLEGCLSRMLVNRSQADVANTAHRLAEDILRFARCRQGGALTRQKHRKEAICRKSKQLNRFY